MAPFPSSNMYSIGHKRKRSELDDMDYDFDDRSAIVDWDLPQQPMPQQPMPQQPVPPQHQPMLGLNAMSRSNVLGFNAMGGGNAQAGLAQAGLAGQRRDQRYGQVQNLQNLQNLPNPFVRFESVGYGTQEF